MASPILPPSPTTPRPSGRTGVALIGIGALALIVSFVQAKFVGLLFLPMLALAFLSWGLTTRNTRLLVPGGILGGIGVGTLLAETVYKSNDMTTTGGIIILSMGLGFLLILPLERSIHTLTQQWELIPGGVLALLGLGLLITPVRGLLADAGKYWPILLIVLGAYFVWNNNRHSPTK